MIDPADLLRADALQAEYAGALDRRDMKGWLECFDSQGSYICITLENVSQGLALPVMMDDCPERLQDRVKFVSAVWAGTYEDYNTRHFVQRVSWRPAPGGLVAMTSNFLVTYTTAAGTSQILGSGVYEDEIIVGPGPLRFRSKKAILDAAIAPRYLVYPI
ncbi:MAG: hypothetical protein JWL74_1315 [Alphaproteobacteria bacterium]|jgi:anthranilate 1,2-dioxygenase small subunit|nr:hypothetical protein [Alphaproteobacteria bacterium]